MTKHIQFSINAPAEWEDILAMVLYEHGAPGLTIDDPAMIAEHLARKDWDASVYEGRHIEVGRITLQAVFPAGTAMDALLKDISSLSRQHQELFDISVADLPEQDWFKAWHDSFPNIELGRKLVVMPYWREGALLPHQEALLISPGQAFGTGDHATTALAAQLMEEYLRPQCRVIDIGAGSGILAIAALKMGASKALAIDNDPLCASSIAEHSLLNGLDEDRLIFLLGDILQDATVQKTCRGFAADVLVSNIVAGVIADLAKIAAAFLSTGGIWVSCGIWHEKEQQALNAFAVNNWQIIKRKERAGWLAFAVKDRE